MHRRILDNRNFRDLQGIPDKKKKPLNFGNIHKKVALAPETSIGENCVYKEFWIPLSVFVFFFGYFSYSRVEKKIAFYDIKTYLGFKRCWLWRKVGTSNSAEKRSRKKWIKNSVEGTRKNTELNWIENSRRRSNKCFYVFTF